MDLIKLTRELGAAIQQDERYIAFVDARKANDDDKELNALIGKLNLIQMNYKNESEKEEPDRAKLDSLDEDSIAKAIIKYGYHISLSMYQFVIHEIEGKWYTPILVFVQKQEPFDCVMCDISEWCYQYFSDEDFVKPGVGAMEFRKLLDLHTECVRNNEWPGAESSIEADGNTRIMKPSVPYWLGMKYFEEF